MITTTTTTAIPTSAPVLLGPLGNLYADALCAGPCGLQALGSLLTAKNSEFSAGITPHEGLQSVLDGLTRMAPRLEEQGVDARPLARVMEEINAGATDNSDTIALSRLAAFLKHVPPAVYREARNAVFTGEGEWSPARSFDLSSEIYVSRFAALRQKEGEYAAKEALPASAFRSRYDVIGNISAKMAIVQLVQERLTGKLYVAKRTMNWTQIEEMEREARAMQSLDHPNILPICEFYRETYEESGVDQFIIIAPYIPRGETLAQMLEKHRFTEPEITSIAAQLLSAVEHMREKGLVHRDIKPSNIMITWNEDGSIKATLFDFGIVKFLGDVTRTSTIGVGTIWWEAPEQLEGGRITTATDIHGLGLVLLSLALGRTRHSDIDHNQPVEADIRRLKEMAAMGSFSNGFVNMIETMLSRDPATRLRALSPSPLGEREGVRGSQSAVIPAEAGIQSVPTFDADFDRLRDNPRSRITVRLPGDVTANDEFAKEALAEFEHIKNVASSSFLRNRQDQNIVSGFGMAGALTIACGGLLWGPTFFAISATVYTLIILLMTIGGLDYIREVRSRKHELPVDLVLADLEETRERIDAETTAAVEENRDVKKIEPPSGENG